MKLKGLLGTLVLVVGSMGINAAEVNTPPIAQFHFEADRYTQGQTVNFKETSFDADGDAILEKKWRVRSLTDANYKDKVGSMFEYVWQDPAPGTYEVSLKVADVHGLWGEWSSQTVQVLPNQKPVITTIKTAKSAYAQGEPLEFEVEIENDEWEEVTKERWTYRKVGSNDNERIIAKPTRFFGEGEYIVTLQVTDALGQASDVEEIIVEVTDEVQYSELAYKFTKGIPGEVIDNLGGFNYRTEYTREENVKIEENDRMLIMSDSPEVVTQNGILYEEIITDEARLLIHHINDFSAEIASNEKLVVLVEPVGDSPVNMTVMNKVVKGPVADQLYLGQLLLRDFLKSDTFELHTLKPGQPTVLFESEAQAWRKGTAISGLMDIRTGGPIKVTVAAVDQKMNLSQVSTLPYLEKDRHPRGTFDTTERTYTVNLAKSKKPSYILLGEGTAEWANGTDAITGEVVQNRGNYGITHRITVTAGKENTGIILNPRGGVFCGAIRWEDGTVNLMPETGYLLGGNTASVVGVIPAGKTVTFDYMLPNGSAAPVLLGFVPESEWK